MKSEVNGLEQRLLFEFIEQNGSYLVFYGEAGLQSADLHPLQVRMLRQNVIEGLLPVTFDETDLVIRLRYRINGKKLLSQVLQYRTLSMREYYEILLRTVTILDDSKLLMLDEEKYVLHENFIFIGEEMTELSFVYLPTKLYALNGSVQERLKQLATTLIAFVEDLHAEGFQAILHFFYTQAFHLSGLKNLLYRLEAGCSEASALKTESRHPSYQGQRESAPAEVSSDSHRPSVEQLDPILQAWAAQGGGAEVPVKGKHGGKQNTFMNKKTELTASTSLYKNLRRTAIAISILGTGLTLKSALEQGPEGLLSIYTLMLAAGLGYLLLSDRMAQRRKSGVSPEQTPEGGFQTGSGSTGEERQAYSGQPQSGQTELNPRLQDKQTGAGGGEIRIIGPDVPTEHYYDVLHLYTDMLGEQMKQVTGNLDFANKPDSREETALSYLVLTGEHELERIAVYEDLFVIGSKADAVHYCLDRQGISRTHLEIANKSGRCVARDLSSKNGTLLNDVKMAPYKEYILGDGDRLRLIDHEFQFFYTLKEPLTAPVPFVRDFVNEVLQ